MNEKEAIEWIAEIFEASVENIQPDMTPDDIPTWDSLGVLSLLAGFDEDFGIQLEDEELQELRSIREILDVFKRHGHL